MIRQVKEGQINWLPGLKLSDIPHPLPAGISIHVRRDELGLEIQGIVGSLPLRDNTTLQIVPKIGTINFLRLLFKAEGYQRDLENEFEAFVEYSVDSEENIDSIVARQLFYAAEEILNRSPQHGRVKCRHAGVFAAGQIDPVATAQNLKCGAQEPVVYTSNDRTEDISENRIITEAVVRAWLILDESSRELFRRVRERWLRRFTRSRDITEDLYHVDEGFATSRYGGPRDYYRKALMLSQIVLGTRGVGITEETTIEGDAILLNTADVFERYLRNVISEAYSAHGYIVMKGGFDRATLYIDGSFELIPDIVITRDNKTLLIADAKYKTPTASDHYQLAAYLNGYGIKRGVILSPLLKGGDIIEDEYSTSGKSVVFELQLPMTNLNATEKFLGSLVERFAV